MKIIKLFMLMLGSTIIALSINAIAADGNDGNIRFANEMVTHNSNPAKQASAPRALPQIQSPLNDIALISSSKVMHSSLGIIIRNQTHKEVLVAIHDSKGRKIMAKSYTGNQSMINIKTAQFRAGTYVYSVMIGDSLFSRPFIVTP